MAKKQSKKTENKYQGNDPLIASMCNAIPADMDMPDSAEDFIASALKTAPRCSNRAHLPNVPVRSTSFSRSSTSASTENKFSKKEVMR